ncbi:MAG: hypothetical protein U1E05_19175 [Patescibacteria group bacterium]|nr:hypothetical protein [Patescibacteria group bacterium]
MITHGCGSYEDRPAACRNFLCAWLADAGWPDAWRPDLAGLLCLREELEPGLVGAAVYEVWPDALQAAEANEILHTLRATTAILVTVDTDGLRRTYTNLEDAPASTPGRIQKSAAA